MKALSLQALNFARVAELVDALDLGSSILTDVGFESPLSYFLPNFNCNPVHLLNKINKAEITWIFL